MCVVEYGKNIVVQIILFLMKRKIRKGIDADLNDFKLLTEKYGIKFK